MERKKRSEGRGEKPYRKTETGRGERKEYGGRPDRREREEKRDEGRKEGRDERRGRPERKEYGGRPERREREEKRDEGRKEGRDERRGRPERKEYGGRPERRERDDRRERPERKEYGGRPERRERDERRDEGRGRPERRERDDRRERPERKEYGGRPERRERDERRDEGRGRPERREWKGKKDYGDKRGKPERREYSGSKRPAYGRKSSEKEGLERLNKYLSNAGICSRREADKLIQAGVVSVNGKIITELGYKVSPGDKVQYEGQSVGREKPRYILLNKPKGYITTTDDPEKRKTVMSLIHGACKERVYPVGRLDRNTTGLLLFTNDGNIAKKLTHPKYGIRKIYHVELDNPLSRADYDKIREGLQLEDGFIKVDHIEYIEGSKSRKELGVELHSGQNRIVRRIFEHFEYKVVKLDRVSYAGLTKKNLPRGEWRFLEEREINLLKMISS